MRPPCDLQPLSASPAEHYFHQVAGAADPGFRSGDVPIAPFKTPVPWTSLFLFRVSGVSDVTDPTLVGSEDYETMCRTCFRRSLEELCWNKLNCRWSVQLRILATVTCWYLFHLWFALIGSETYRYDDARAMDSPGLLPQSVMNMCSPANAMPDLWRTSLVKDGISWAKHATLSWNLQPRLPCELTRDHLWPGNATKTERQSPVELRFVVSLDPGKNM